MSHKKRSKLPSMKFKRYGSSKTLYLETNSRNGSNSVLLRMEEGQATQRSKYSYWLTFGYYKSDRLKTIGVDLVE